MGKQETSLKFEPHSRHDRRISYQAGEGIATFWSICELLLISIDEVDVSIMITVRLLQHLGSRTRVGARRHRIQKIFTDHCLLANLH